MRTRSTALLVLTGLLLVASLAPREAAAQTIQKTGVQEFPGRFLLTAHPIGFQAGYNLGSGSGLKFGVQLAFKVADVKDVGLYVGVEFDYTLGLLNCGGFFVGTVCNHDVQLGAFVMATFEKFLKIPLVPYARAGGVGDIFIYEGVGQALAGGGGLKLAGGAHWFLTRNVGLGAEMAFTMGGAQLANNFGSRSVGFYGSWDFTLGGRFAF